MLTRPGDARAIVPALLLAVLLAHGALGDAKLVRRPREAFMAGGGLEGLERIERRQSARHPDIIA